MPTPGGVMVLRSGCAPWVSFWGGGWLLLVGRLPGSLVMVWRSLRALMSFGLWLLMV